MSYPSSPLSPYLGALELQLALGPIYKFVSLSLMVIYQLESLHLDDYNLIYSQNKNIVFFYKILTTFPLKTQHFPFLQTLNKTNSNQSQPTIQKNLNTILKLIYNQKKNFFYPHLGVSPTQTQEQRGLGLLLISNLFQSSMQSFLLVFDHFRL